jgi:nucleoside-diphosphate-sugar epimerase
MAMKCAAPMAGNAKTALIAGATGVAGRNLLRHLLEQGEWDVIAVSRRVPDVPGEYRHLAVDLMDAADTSVKLGGAAGRALGVTHIFHMAYVNLPDWGDLIGPNLTLLQNLIEALAPTSSDLQHVHLIEGTKWYGCHLGPFPVPAKEHDPRPAGPVFYHAQQDFLEAQQAGNSWSWSAARPHGICGFALGNSLNLDNVLAVYATVLKALDQPLRHPGSWENAQALYQASDSGLLSRGIEWMATTPACANQAFKITNGDLYRWPDLWPRIADWFAMDYVPPKPGDDSISLQALMADKAGLWAGLVAEHGLQDVAFDQFVSWAYGDYAFANTWDIASSVEKAHGFGFTEAMDTGDMFLAHFQAMRDVKVIP